MKKFICTFFTFLLVSNFTFSQTVGEKYIWEFRDGTIIYGEFVKTTNVNIIITDDTGEEVYIPKVMIAQRHVANEENYKDGEYFFPNLHDTRYFFSPSAFGLEKGEGYYNSTYWMFWQFQYGISDKISIGGGATLFGFPSSVNLKYSDNISDNLNYSFGYFYVGDLFNIIDNDQTNLLSMPYALITRGSKEKNISVGLSYNFAQPFNDINYESGFSSERLVLNVGAISRLSTRYAFVFEGWFLNPDNLFFMGGPGIRYFSKVKRITAKNGAGAKTVDFQIFIMSGSDGNVAFPTIGRSWRF
tara:strand:- start:1609 stop:2511 length:903 start_codon:yes stop_codon:yes gene_type:complete